MQRLFKRKPQETSEQELMGKGIRYLVAGLLMISLFDLAITLVFNIASKSI